MSTPAYPSSLTDAQWGLVAPLARRGELRGVGRGLHLGFEAAVTLPPAAMAACTWAVMAIFVELSLPDCVVAVGLPVSAGLASGA